MFRSLTAPIAAILMTAAASCASATPPVEEAMTFTANSGERVEAMSGFIMVPENRSNPESRSIKLAYVRFPATGERAGPPIVYLAGGPGGSGIQTAKGRRFPLFMAMREFGDVIALDQRGTGASSDVPPCVSNLKAPDDRDVSYAEYADLYRRSVEECEKTWRADGVDVAGYTTDESADDIDALRAALGAEKVTLWGISYGTHLAMAAVKRMGARIDRLVLASAEGLDQTVKLPARTDAYFSRLQAVIDADPAAKAMFPDIKALMRRVHAKLEAEPVKLDIPKEGGAAPFLLTRRDMQMMASAMIADPENAAMLMQLYLAADHGMYEPIAGVIARFGGVNDPISWSVMPLAMDVASGISGERLALVNKQAKTALLGDYLNFPMPHLRGSLGGLDLGEDFREKPVSDVPTLLFSATLDGRTYPESQLEALSGMSNLTTVTVVNAGHNLYMTSPDVTEVIQAFMRGETVTKTQIVVPPPSFAMTRE